MARPSAQLELPLPARRAGVSLQDWLYRELRDAVLNRRLQSGARLPATRDLARQHQVSRSTVVAVFEQLGAEGYVVSRPGSGTVVASTVPDGFLRASPPKPKPTQPPVVGTTAAAPPSVFTPCAPPADIFPAKEWTRLITRRLRRDTNAMLQRTDPRGNPRLRREIAAYLGSARGVRCAPEQIVIVTGTQQALDFVGRLLLRKPNDAAWVEDPGYEGAISAFRQTGARLVPVPVDDEGLDVEAGLHLAPHPRLVYVTPANQFPLGRTLSLARRTRLLEEAAARSFYVFEDDYDGEFRYDVRPLGSLQGQDTAGRVIYSGSFNKLLHTGLRLGYVVLPPALVDPFLELRDSADRYLPTLEQAALADFFAEGLFQRHLRRAREACLIRRDTLLAAVARHLPDRLECAPCHAGFHLLARILDGTPDHVLTAVAAEHRVRLWPLSPVYLEHPRDDRVVLGFSSHTPGVLQAATRRLAEAWATLPHR